MAALSSSSIELPTSQSNNSNFRSKTSLLVYREQIFTFPDQYFVSNSIQPIRSLNRCRRSRSRGQKSHQYLRLSKTQQRISIRYLQAPLKSSRGIRAPLTRF